jgi:hypothetical protein
MNDTEFRAVLDWFMISDPWDDIVPHGVIEDWIERESNARGHQTWVDAYHNHSPITADDGQFGVVERLRRYGSGSPDSLLLMREAADELERLKRTAFDKDVEIERLTRELQMRLVDEALAATAPDAAVKLSCGHPGDRAETMRAGDFVLCKQCGGMSTIVELP